MKEIFKRALLILSLPLYLIICECIWISENICEPISVFINDLIDMIEDGWKEIFNILFSNKK